MHDLALAIRLLRKSPAFTLLALLCLALGIGVNASIFSLLDSVYLRPLPVGNADRVVVLSRAASPRFPYPEYRALRDRNQSLDGLAVSEPEESDLSFEGKAMLIGAEPVSANYAAVLGARTCLGRWFTREDEPAAVISYHAWQQLFHGDRGVLGKTIRSESHAYTVVGVAPPEFAGIYAPLRIDLWVPFRYWAGNDADRRLAMVFGCLKHGVGVSQATAELNAVATLSHRENPNLAKDAHAPLALELVRGIPNPVGRRQAMPVVMLLMTVVALVLLIACMNVGNLLVARGLGRQREIAVRLALGAGRARVLRQLMTENLALGLLGGAAGVLVGYATNRLLVAALPMLPFGEVFRLDLPLDYRVLLYTGSVALLTALLFGLLPALQSSRGDLPAVLRGANVAGGRLRLRLAMLTGQIALSLVLLLTAGLFARLVVGFHYLDPGFASANRLYAPAFVPAPQFTPASGRVFYDRTLARLRALSGVRGASLTTRLPMYAAGIAGTCVAREGDHPMPATSTTIDRDFLNTLRIPLLEGRGFSSADEVDRPPVAIVNQTLARRLWPNQPAAGRTFQAGCDHPRTLQVVGARFEDPLHERGHAAALLLAVLAGVRGRHRVPRGGNGRRRRPSDGARAPNAGLRRPRFPHLRRPPSQRFAGRLLVAGALRTLDPGDSRGAGAGARRGRDVRRVGVPRHGAHARNRHPRGPRRAPARRGPAGDRPRLAGDRCRCRHRLADFCPGLPAACLAASRREPHGRGHLVGGGSRVDRAGPRGVLAAGASRRPRPASRRAQARMRRRRAQPNTAWYIVQTAFYRILAVRLHRGAANLGRSRLFRRPGQAKSRLRAECPPSTLF
jgi:predicted permease